MVNAPEAICKFGEQHHGEAANAEVCAACYERLQERVDVFEAALHLDLKEAAQIIYDAVWSDPSDPTKTYQNAASAILTELRKRAGDDYSVGPVPAAYSRELAGLKRESIRNEGKTSLDCL